MFCTFGAFGIECPGLDPDVRLTNDPAISFTAGNNAWSVAASGDTIHVVWYDSRDGNMEIYYKRSIDGGTTWSSDTRLTNDGWGSASPSVAVLGSTVHVVWYDERNTNYEIYYKRSTNDGVSWGSDTRLTNNNSSSSFPTVAAQGLKVHAVWVDERDGNKEVYYKRGGEIQPDNLIKNLDESEYTGDDVYNDDGTDQTKEQNVVPGDTAIYHIRIANDGNLIDTVTVTGTGSVEGWRVYYYDALEGGTYITSQVTESGWSTGKLNPGEYKEIRVEVRPDEDVSGDSTFYVLITSTSKRDNTKKDAVKASTTTELICQPDNQIKNFDETTYIGDSLYNIDGSNQTKSQSAEAGDTVIYHVKVENDGNLSDTIIVTGTPGNAGWTVRYFDALTAGTEITSDVIGSGWSTGELVSGGAVEIRVEVTPPASASDGTLYDVLVTATSTIDDTCEDAVKATTAVETGGVEEKAAPLAYSLDVPPLSSGKDCTIAYTLPQSSYATLSIYDATGALVENLADGSMPSGNHISIWEGNAGVYFVRLETPDRVLTRKLIVVK